MVKEKQHECECGKKFATKSNLNYHKLHHCSLLKTKTSFTCAKCGNNLSTKINLSAHKKTCPLVDSKIKYICNCGSEFTTKINLSCATYD